jgi:Domain of unknown function (DUF4258)
MYSQRFGRPVTVTQHASRRMAEREVSEALLLDLIETGDVRHKDETRLWIAKQYPERADNLLCVAVVLETSVVIKTLMHHFTWDLQP